MSPPTRWRDLHPAERRRERRRRDLAYAGHLVLGVVLLLALLGQVIDPHGVAYRVLKLLLGPWTLIAALPTALLTTVLSLRRSRLHHGGLGRPRGLAVLGLLLLALPGALGAGDQVDWLATWLALPLLLAYTALALGLAPRWLLVQRRQIRFD
ncbi:MAG: hypothetical protein AAGC60_24145 [Acidobacteriota bacterium]